jgi:hypothetical protein
MWALVIVTPLAAFAALLALARLEAALLPAGDDRRRRDSRPSRR